MTTGVDPFKDHFFRGITSSHRIFWIQYRFCMAMRAFDFYRFVGSREACQADPHIDPFMPAPVIENLATAITTWCHTVTQQDFSGIKAGHEGRESEIDSKTAKIHFI